MIEILDFIAADSDRRAFLAEPQQGLIRMASGRPESRKRLAIIAGSGLLPCPSGAGGPPARRKPVHLGARQRGRSGLVGLRAPARRRRRLCRPRADAFDREGVDRAVLSGAVQRRPEWRDIRPTLRTLLADSRGRAHALERRRRHRPEDGHPADRGERRARRRRTRDRTGAAGDGGRHRQDGSGRRGSAGHRGGSRRGAARSALSTSGRAPSPSAVGWWRWKGAEGTDQMLERVADLRRQGRISQQPQGRSGQAVQAPAGHPRRSAVDRAATRCIGPLAAGLAGIAIEAGRSLVLDRERHGRGGGSRRAVRLRYRCRGNRSDADDPSAQARRDCRGGFRRPAGRDLVAALRRQVPDGVVAGRCRRRGAAGARARFAVRLFRAVDHGRSRRCWRSCRN